MTCFMIGNIAYIFYGEMAHGNFKKNRYDVSIMTQFISFRRGDRMRAKTLPRTALILLSLVLAACATQQVPVSSFVKMTAPDFTLDDALGGQTSLTDYAETPVLLFFHMAVG